MLESYKRQENNIQTEYEFEVGNLLSYKSFDNEGKCVLTQNITAIETNLSLTFTKLSPDMYEKAKGK